MSIDPISKRPTHHAPRAGSGPRTESGRESPEARRADARLAVSEPRSLHEPRSRSEPREQLRVGSALRACQVASERCGRAIPELSSLEDGRVQLLTDCLELTELCAQALGRALEGIDSLFLEDELTLCAKVARTCAGVLDDDEALEPCARACLDCADWCDRVLDARRSSDSRSAA